jgi:hypothetical protein
VSLKTTSRASDSAVLAGDVTVPGSVANLGGGFDTLGVAVQLYLRARIVDVREDGGTRLVVTQSSPPVKGHNALERAFHLIAERTGIKTPTVHVEVESAIPMAAGLGSSAAATVAGLRLFEKVDAPPVGSRAAGGSHRPRRARRQRRSGPLWRPHVGDCRRGARARSAPLDLAR